MSSQLVGFRFNGFAHFLAPFLYDAKSFWISWDNCDRCACCAGQKRRSKDRGVSQHARGGPIVGHGLLTLFDTFYGSGD